MRKKKFFTMDLENFCQSLPKLVRNLKFLQRARYRLMPMNEKYFFPILTHITD